MRTGPLPLAAPPCQLSESSSILLSQNSRAHLLILRLFQCHYLLLQIFPKVSQKQTNQQKIIEQKQNLAPDWSNKSQNCNYCIFLMGLPIAQTCIKGPEKSCRKEAYSSRLGLTQGLPDLIGTEPVLHWLLFLLSLSHISFSI